MPESTAASCVSVRAFCFALTSSFVASPVTSPVLPLTDVTGALCSAVSALPSDVCTELAKSLLGIPSDGLVYFALTSLVVARPVTAPLCPFTLETNLVLDGNAPTSPAPRVTSPVFPLTDVTGALCNAVSAFPKEVFTSSANLTVISLTKL